MAKRKVSAAILAARSGWRYTGAERPDFADATGPGQESVWDYPRPPGSGPIWPNDV
jgi:hypothetical protein